MSSQFVWFDNLSANRAATADFMHSAFGWAPKDIGSMVFLTAEGEQLPFAAVCDEMGGLTGWVPYLEVEDLAVAVANARGHGAEIIAENLKGPAGDASFIRDPGGSPMALWKRAPGN